MGILRIAKEGQGITPVYKLSELCSVSAIVYTTLITMYTLNIIS